MTKLFSMIEKQDVHSDSKIVKAKEFSKIVDAKEILKKTREQKIAYKLAVSQECETLKEQAQKEGFDAGLAKWNEQLLQLKSEVDYLQEETQKSIVPIAIAAVKKLIGRELETDPRTIVDIVSTALKPVSQHKRISIYVHKNDLQIIEERRADIKEIFEHVEVLSISAREDVEAGGCVIETEAGIINAQLESQLSALKSAFVNFFQNQKEEQS